MNQRCLFVVSHEHHLQVVPSTILGGCALGGTACHIRTDYDVAHSGIIESAGLASTSSNPSNKTSIEDSPTKNGAIASLAMSDIMPQADWHCVGSNHGLLQSWIEAQR